MANDLIDKGLMILGVGIAIMSTIREAKTEDVRTIKSLVSETLRRCVVEDEESYGTIFSEICTTIDSWVECPKDTVYLVYERDEKIVGLVLIAHYERMKLLFVHPECQKAGIGTALLDSALEACRLSGESRRVTLNSSSYAAGFYRKYGFVPDGEPEERPGGCVPLAIDL